jgi:hypothetical protein
MAVSDVLICNQALSRIGNGYRIASLSEASAEAIACGLHLDTCRERLLAESPWHFATAYATLGLVEENPNEDWTYAYRLPVDCITARRVFTAADATGTGGDGRKMADQTPFAIGHDSAGRLVMTDLVSAALEYTARITNPAFYPPVFVSALAWLLASEIAMPLARSEKMMMMALQMYAAELGHARGLAANERVRDPDPLPEALRVR